MNKRINAVYDRTVKLTTLVGNATVAEAAIESYVAIYGLIDPRDDEIMYVGKTVELMGRFFKHLTRPAGRVAPWIHELLGIGHVPIMALLCITPKNGWGQVERDWIARLSPPLNMRSGGEGDDSADDRTETAILATLAPWMKDVRQTVIEAASVLTLKRYDIATELNSLRACRSFRDKDCARTLQSAFEHLPQDVQVAIVDYIHLVTETAQSV